MLAASNYSRVAKELGVSDNAIRKHLKVHHERMMLVGPPGNDPGISSV